MKCFEQLVNLLDDCSTDYKEIQLTCRSRLSIQLYYAYVKACLLNGSIRMEENLKWFIT